MCIWAVRVFLGVLLCASCRCSACPLGCECSADTRTVRCASQDLRAVPHGIPGYARTVIITGNRIYRLGPDSFTELRNVTNITLGNNGITEVASHSFSALPALHHLDLSANQLALIHPEAFSIPGSPLRELNLSRSLFNSTSLTDLATALRWGDLGGLLRLDLSGNRLALLPPGALAHLPDLQHLLLADNSLGVVHNGTFSGPEHLETLDLRRNAFRMLDADAVGELGRLGSAARVLLGQNPYDCSCEVRGFAAWLNGSAEVVEDAEDVRCASPEALRGRRLRGLGAEALGCDAVPVQEGATAVGAVDISLHTSYVFLGLVLGFVGMVFLFVVYLNRSGMKRRVVDLRDACRDVLEGYHYRYELDSDPRLGQLAANGGAGRAPGNAGFGTAPHAPAPMPADACAARMPSDTELEQGGDPLTL